MDDVRKKAIEAAIAAWSEDQFMELPELIATYERALWQPIDTAPKHGHPIIIGIAATGYHAACVEWSDDGKCWIVPTTTRKLLIEPTHWRPLPKPPEDPDG